MIEFDRSTRIFRDTSTGDFTRIERHHPRENYFVIHHQRGHVQIRLSAEIRRKDADLLVIFTKSDFHSQDRGCWLHFRGSDALLSGLTPFLKAWAELDSEWVRWGRVLLTDSRPQSDPTFEQAIEPPSDAMLKALQASFESRR